jgi:hypothetical protein
VPANRARIASRQRSPTSTKSRKLGGQVGAAGKLVHALQDLLRRDRDAKPLGLRPLQAFFDQRLQRFTLWIAATAEKLDELRPLDDLVFGHDRAVDLDPRGKEVLLRHGRRRCAKAKHQKPCRAPDRPCVA